MWHETFLNWTGGVANIATTIAIVVGGIWIWRRFSVSREARPRAVLAHHMEACNASADSVLLRVEVTVTNSGAVKLLVGKLFVRLQQIAPCDCDALQKFMVADKHKLEGDWPLIGERSVPNPRCFIEPGENELFEFEFVIPKAVEIVSVYTHVENPTTPGSGWSCSSWQKCKELLT